MDAAIAANARLCAYASLSGELSVIYPAAKFVYRPTLSAMLQSFENQECDAIAIGEPEVRMSPTVLEFFCKHDLVSSGVLVQSVVVALPTQAEIVGGLSHWMRLGESQGVRYLDVLATYRPAIEYGCSLDIDTVADTPLMQLGVFDMFFCFVVLSLSIVIAFILKCCSHNIEKFGIELEFTVRSRFTKKLLDAERKLGKKSGVNEVRRQELRPLLTSTFQQWDIDNDGVLGIKELHEGLKSLDINLTKWEIDEILRLLDQNDDGQVDLSEFVEAFDVAEEDGLSVEVRRWQKQMQQLHHLEARLGAQIAGLKDHIRAGPAQEQAAIPPIRRRASKASLKL